MTAGERPAAGPVPAGPKARIVETVESKEY
jgi:hypothetical protein